MSVTGRGGERRGRRSRRKMRRGPGGVRKEQRRKRKIRRGRERER